MTNAQSAQAQESGTGEHPGRRLAWAAIDKILAHPELHDQGVWLKQTECGTAGCLAGHVTLLAGDTPTTWHVDSFGFDTGIGESVISSATGRRRLVSARARELLYITDGQADELFNDGNSVGYLIDSVTHIFGPKPEAQGEQAS